MNDHDNGPASAGPVRDACAALGGVSATARAMDTSRRKIQQWLTLGCVPKSRPCFRLADLSGVSARLLAGADYATGSQTGVQ